MKITELLNDCKLDIQIKADSDHSLKAVIFENGLNRQITLQRSTQQEFIDRLFIEGKAADTFGITKKACDFLKEDCLTLQSRLSAE